MIGILSSIYMFSYIASNTFPKPLNIEQEREYFREYKEGKKDAKDILIERNLRLVAHIVKKYNGKENEDLISIGTIGLIKAINTFREDKGVRLATYAARCIENEILMYIRATKKYGNDVSMQGPIGIDNEGNEISLEDKLYDDKSDIEDEIDLRIKSGRVGRLIKTILQGREKLIIGLRYGLINGYEKTQREIAELLGISRSYVSRIEKKALGKLNERLKDGV